MHHLRLKKKRIWKQTNEKKGQKLFCVVVVVVVVVVFNTKCTLKRAY